IALALIAHTDSRLDADALRRFVEAFQTVTPLTIGELWAIPITLRIALVERLTPLTQWIVAAREEREQASALADRLLAYALSEDFKPSRLVARLSDELGPPEAFKRAFLVQLIQQLRDQDPNVLPASEWIDAQLALHHGTTSALLTQVEHNVLATTQVTVGSIITSMRLLSTLDWRKFVESVSLVDPILAREPGGVYARMDFATRDRYRHAVERIARRAGRPEDQNELVVARYALEMAQERNTHIGRFLIGRELPRLEKRCGYRQTIRERVSRATTRFPTLLYLGLLFLSTALLTLPIAKALLAHGFGMPARLLLGLLASLLMSEVAIGFVNHYVPFFFRPSPLPRMDTEQGLPNGTQVMVVIPTLLVRESVVRDLIESLHVHYLGNPDPNISFALLSDYTDAQTASRQGDEALLALAQTGIDQLNARYPAEGRRRFHLFHRRRQWNPKEGSFLGWERKRGKIHEFNRLLRGAKDTSFEVATATAAELAGIEYVITLDSDTRLPREAALKLVGTILHPLNQPRVDPVSRRVVEGYGILQPRISVELPSAGQTRFARIFSGNIGLDPYTTAVSDVYQDIFEEGSFTGKGLYVVDAFEAALAERVPENRLLSHDLFEGTFARSGLVTDVEMFDDFPSTYQVYSKRQHRWTRGDWQIARWILPWAPTARQVNAPNPLSLISRWKLFDNLRRSVVPPAMILWLVLAWSFLPGPTFLWTVPVLLILTFPLYGPVSRTLLVRRRGLPWGSYFRDVGKQFWSQLEQSLLTSAFLARQAYNQTDAIVRTLYRLLVSKRKFLEWVSFAQAEQGRGSKVALRERIGPAPVISITLTALVVVARPDALVIAAPFLLLWALNPLIERYLAGEVQATEVPLGEAETLDFRRYARRTWNYFETFVGPEGNWLAPDNFQQHPNPVVAFRTSPTNIGLQLLATGAALDFGYVGRCEFADRVEKTLDTLMRLERFHGHFFNWYDTKTLAPLMPRYVSTVDSGNLAAHLITLKQACLGYMGL
ncbi:MAG: DUF3131 domain-containing protein, partial [Deltaproteobacteria bacterium]|nr:DUF3131 domain-containing protein [Deltaproteobacteria bacterium]